MRCLISFIKFWYRCFIFINKVEQKYPKNRRSSVDNSSYEIPKLDDKSVLSQTAQYRTPKRGNKRSPSPNKVLSLEDVNNLSYSFINAPVKKNSANSKEKRILSELIGRLLICLVNIRSPLAKVTNTNFVSTNKFEINIYEIMIRLKHNLKDQLHIQLSVEGFKKVVEDVNKSLLVLFNGKYQNTDLMKFINILLPALPNEVQYDIIK